MLLLVALGAVLVLAGGLLVTARLSRGGRRVTAQSAALVIGVPAAVGFIVVVPTNGASISAALSVVGVIASFIFGFAGNQMNVSAARRPKVGVVIASKDPFHQDLRRGLYRELETIEATIIDDGANPAAAREDLLGFDDLLQRTAEKNPDFLVIWAPGLVAADRQRTYEIAARLHRRGGLCIFLENGPSSPEVCKQFALIRHDAPKTANLIVAAVRELSGGNERILVVHGPAQTGPGRLRSEVLRKEFPESHASHSIQLRSWVPSEAVTAIAGAVKRDFQPTIVVCPNDSIALAVAAATARNGALRKLQEAKIVGCDGLPRACASIAEHASPLEATVAIPPSEYGCHAGLLIRKLHRVSIHPRRDLREACSNVTLELDARNIVNPARARRRLYDDE